MTTVDQHLGSASPVVQRLRDLLDQIMQVPAFSSPLVNDEYRAGYAASRNDIVAQVDAEVTDLLSVYDVLDVAGSVFEPTELGRFLMTRAKQLGGRTPLDVIEAGEAVRVLELLASEYEGQIR